MFDVKILSFSVGLAAHDQCRIEQQLSRWFCGNDVPMLGLWIESREATMQEEADYEALLKEHADET